YRTERLRRGQHGAKQASVLHGLCNDGLHGLLHDHSLAAGERDDGVRALLYRANEFGVQDELLVVEPGEGDHGEKTNDDDVTGSVRSKPAVSYLPRTSSCCIN